MVTKRFLEEQSRKCLLLLPSAFPLPFMNIPAPFRERRLQRQRSAVKPSYPLLCFSVSKMDTPAPCREAPSTPKRKPKRCPWALPRVRRGSQGCHCRWPLTARRPSLTACPRGWELLTGWPWVWKLLTAWHWVQTAWHTVPESGLCCVAPSD